MTSPARPVSLSRSRRDIWRQLLVFALLVWTAYPVPARVATPPATEYQVKAAYLYNFARFIEWPAAAPAATGDRLVIGVVGTDPFGRLLDETVRDKAAPDDPRLEVRRFTRLDDVIHADILFISASEAERLPQILKVLDGASVLTVGDMDRFAERGGMVELKLEDKKVRFEINLAAVRRAKLKLSSQLLKLARILGDDGGPRP